MQGYDDSWYGVPNYAGTYAQHLQQSQQPRTLGQIISSVRSLGDSLGRGGVGNSPNALGQHAQRYDVPSTMQIPSQFMQNMVKGQVSYPRAWLRNQQPEGVSPDHNTPYSGPEMITDPVIDNIKNSGQFNLQPTAPPATTGGGSAVSGTSGSGGLSSIPTSGGSSGSSSSGGSGYNAGPGISQTSSTLPSSSGGGGTLGSAAARAASALPRRSSPMSIKRPK